MRTALDKMDDDDRPVESSSPRPPPWMDHDYQDGFAESSSSSTPKHVTPPLPPPEFNPPPDLSESSVFAALSEVDSSTRSFSSSSSSLTAMVGLFTASELDGEAGPSSGELHRPKLRALQQVSNDSIGSRSSYSSKPGSGEKVMSDSGSEGGGHLVEARERLLSSEGSGSSSGPPSRRDSAGAPEEILLTSTGNTSSSGTPPSIQSESTTTSKPGPSRRRAGSFNSPPIIQELSPEHAWDSVWPTPGAIAKGPTMNDPGPSRLFMAPVSPFVTPSFSPALISTTSMPRRATSPTFSPLNVQRNPSPSQKRFSPRPGASPIIESQEPTRLNRRRQSISEGEGFFAHSPPKAAPVSINRHQRSQSSQLGSSPTTRSFMLSMDRMKKSSPPASPPCSPRRISAPLPPSPSLLDRPSSPRRAITMRRPPIPTKLGESSGSRRDFSPKPDKGKAPMQNSSSSPGLQPSEDGPNSPGHNNHSSPQSKASPVHDQPHDSGPAESTNSIPPVILPPPISSPPPVPDSPIHVEEPPPEPAGDDGLPEPSIKLHSTEVIPDGERDGVSPPLFQPLARPSPFRRAVSDTDPHLKPPPVKPKFTRSLTGDVTESERLAKRAQAFADLPSPHSPAPGRDMDLTRIRKSPKLDSTATTVGSSKMSKVNEGSSTSSGSVKPERDKPIADHMGQVELIDEGDVLPEMDLSMDVTFEDEGLNTLERIFLLSKSDFPFHRAYIARVLGDLLYDVDPCESVEYVLPLISQFTVDDDDSVKEAFAAEFHRILWYFFSRCRVVSTEFLVGDQDVMQVEYSPAIPTVPLLSPDESLPETSPGLTVIPIPGVKIVTEPKESIEAEDNTIGSTVSGGTTTSSSGGSSLTRPASSSISSGATGSIDTPGAETPDSITTVSSQDTAASPSILVNPFAEDLDPDKGWTKEVGPLAPLPTIPVEFFTPLLGAMLLNTNPELQESVRSAIVSVIARLRGKGDLSAERWGSRGVGEIDERRTFASQTGPHSHDLRPMGEEQRQIVERELLEGIVIGMGQLSTEMPEHLFPPETGEEPTMEDGQRVLDAYADQYTPGGGGGGPVTPSDDFAMSMTESESGLDTPFENQGSNRDRDRDAFQIQLIQEAAAGRATSMNLIGALCEYFTGEEAVSKGFIDEVLRCGDGDIAIRAEGAVALSMVAKIAPVEHVYRMIPLFEQLASDEIPQVVQSACLSLPAICRRIENSEDQRSFAIKALKTFISSGDDVRCALLEVLGELIHVFHNDPKGPPVELIQVYLDDSEIGQGLGQDWDVIASFNLPGVALTLGPSRWSELQPLYIRLNYSEHPQVRRTLAASLHEYAKILEPDQVARDLMNVYSSCIHSEDEIRELTFEHVDEFFKNLPIDLAWETFIHLAEAWKADQLGGWRAREQLALHIPSFFEIFGEHPGVDAVLEMMRDALLDPFAAVRDAATKGIPESYVVLGQESEIARKFRETLLELGTSSKFRQRVTFVRCLREFVKPPPNRKAFEDIFLPALPRLSQDVIDVRLGLAQTIADLFVVGAFYGKKVRVPNGLITLADTLSHDDAVDVRDTIRKVDLTALHKGESVPYEVQSGEDKPMRGALPPGIPGIGIDDHGPYGDSSHSGYTASTPNPPESKSDIPTKQSLAPMSSPGIPALIRRPSAEVTSRLGSMRLAAYSPGFGSSGSGSTTPMRSPLAATATPARGEDGYLSSPSPTAVHRQTDPFAASFAEATTPRESPTLS